MPTQRGFVRHVYHRQAHVNLETWYTEVLEVNVHQKSNGQVADANGYMVLRGPMRKVPYSSLNGWGLYPDIIPFKWRESTIDAILLMAQGCAAAEPGERATRKCYYLILEPASAKATFTRVGVFCAFSSERVFDHQNNLRRGTGRTNTANTAPSWPARNHVSVQQSGPPSTGTRRRHLQRRGCKSGWATS
ncbi:hypothetical protein EJ06DRAFT_68542 [Trichodelitschia bisporula]|uniref:Uncharacterized protein n=1 Tax=Trichodelitschia bisporula TaxID=703511 RepID=A0A6G1HSL3_9PEZI|nr:hypothetical protein EJ06DRAFT_68542 [Trichodelitschia bisporula]